MVAPRRPRREGRPRFYARRKVCTFCVNHVKVIDYKDAGRLNRYLSDRAKIEPRRKTWTCATHQRHLTMALKRARHLALLPFSVNHVRLTRWPTTRVLRPQAVAVAAPAAETETPVAVEAEAPTAEAAAPAAEAQAPAEAEAEAPAAETEAPTAEAAAPEQTTDKKEEEDEAH